MMEQTNTWGLAIIFAVLVCYILTLVVLARLARSTITQDVSLTYVYICNIGSFKPGTTPCTHPWPCGLAYNRA